MSTLATVDPTSTKVPVLAAGDISPGVMMDFKNVSLDFFCFKVCSCRKTGYNDYPWNQISASS
jgi:hypothetical protein